jgi:hypothetical protein
VPLDLVIGGPLPLPEQQPHHEGQQDKADRRGDADANQRPAVWAAVGATVTLVIAAAARAGLTLVAVIAGFRLPR